MGPPSKTGSLVKRALETTLELDKNHKLRLLVDGGSENKGEAMEKLERQGGFNGETPLERFKKYWTADNEI